MMERRVKYCFVSEEEILHRVLSPFPTWNAVIQHTELPKGYQICRVVHDHERGGFLFLVYHPSFPEIKEGAVIPVVDDFNRVMKAYTVKPYTPEQAGGVV